eukprot:GFYU01015902.1.p1 GENE.GFYU01015902.1~~GFYU01015902.1.p1  ORF type:complete len:602 (-),score=82.45 GFYU01015902.1:144-1949(-)
MSLAGESIYLSEFNPSSPWVRGEHYGRPQTALAKYLERTEAEAHYYSQDDMHLSRQIPNSRYWWKPCSLAYSTPRRTRDGGDSSAVEYVTTTPQTTAKSEGVRKAATMVPTPRRYTPEPSSCAHQLYYFERRRQKMMEGRLPYNGDPSMMASIHLSPEVNLIEKYLSGEPRVFKSPVHRPVPHTPYNTPYNSVEASPAMRSLAGLSDVVQHPSTPRFNRPPPDTHLHTPRSDYTSPSDHHINRSGRERTLSSPKRFSKSPPGPGRRSPSHAYSKAQEYGLEHHLLSPSQQYRAALSPARARGASNASAYSAATSIPVPQPRRPLPRRAHSTIIRALSPTGGVVRDLYQAHRSPSPSRSTPRMRSRGPEMSPNDWANSLRNNARLNHHTHLQRQRPRPRSAPHMRPPSQDYSYHEPLETPPSASSRSRGGSTSFSLGPSAMRVNPNSPTPKSRITADVSRPSTPLRMSNTQTHVTSTPTADSVSGGSPKGRGRSSSRVSISSPPTSPRSTARQLRQSIADATESLQQLGVSLGTPESQSGDSDGWRPGKPSVAYLKALEIAYSPHDRKADLPRRYQSTLTEFTPEQLPSLPDTEEWEQKYGI